MVYDPPKYMEARPRASRAAASSVSGRSVEPEHDFVLKQNLVMKAVLGVFGVALISGLSLVFTMCEPGSLID